MPELPPWVGERLRPAEADRLLVVVSDVEMGAGGPADDFPQTDWLVEVLRRYAGPPYEDLAVSFVFNGDTFDFLKTPAAPGAYSHHVDLSVARAKFRRIAAAHADFFTGLRELLADPRREAHFVVGNHDPELLFVGVQRDVLGLLGAPGRVHFHPWAYTGPGLRIEHGSQGDPLFRMDPAQPFAKADGRDVIALPWASVALLDVAMPMQPLLYHVDRLKPRERVLELLPEVRELIVGSYWRYWTQDYLRQTLLGGDPMKRVSWTMFKEIVYRFRSGDMSLSVADRYARWLERPEAPHLWIIGHEHSPAVHRWGARQLLVTGCWRNEYALSADGLHQRRLPITYAEVFYRGDEIVRAGLVEVPSPPLPDGYCPASVFDLLPTVKQLLAPPAERAAIEAARVAQEAAEAAGKR